MRSIVTRVSAVEAKALCDAGWDYLDVRTDEEFAMGHPKGARNVPFLVSEAGELRANSSFVEDVTSIFPSTTKLVVGCASGVRSARAVEQLRDAGFEALADVRPGFAGVRDSFGRVIERGWLAEGLPIGMGLSDVDEAQCP